MNRASAYNILAIVVPIACLLFGVYIAYKQYTRLTSDRDELKQVEKQMAIAAEQLRVANEMTGPARIPTVPASRQEQAMFLDALRRSAAANSVVLTRYGTAAAPAGEKKEGVPADVTAMGATLEAVGPYAGTRGLLYSLLRYPRLLNVTDIKWGREQDLGRTRLGFTVTRYVTPPLLQTPPPATQAPPPAKPGAPAAGVQ